jgi:hypothetical protein
MKLPIKEQKLLLVTTLCSSLTYVYTYVHMYALLWFQASTLYANNLAKFLLYMQVTSEKKVAPFLSAAKKSFPLMKRADTHCHTGERGSLLRRREGRHRPREPRPQQRPPLLAPQSADPGHHAPFLQTQR